MPAAVSCRGIKHLMLNPLRSEGEAFRLLLYVAAVFIVLIALILILRAIL